jgi:hypothetical protein
VPPLRARGEVVISPQVDFHAKWCYIGTLWYNVYMAVLNLRGIDPEIMAALKMAAARDGKTLRQHCIDVLRGGMFTLPAGSTVTALEITLPERKPEVQSRYAGCPDCGSLIGHQKWCKGK